MTSFASRVTLQVFELLTLSGERSKATICDLNEDSQPLYVSADSRFLVPSILGTKISSHLHQLKPISPIGYSCFLFSMCYRLNFIIFIKFPKVYIFVY